MSNDQLPAPRQTATRRDVLRRTAVGGGLVFSMPAIRTIRVPALAQVGSDGPPRGVGYRLRISGNTNFPTMTLSNASSHSQWEITRFVFTIGDVLRHFDQDEGVTTIDTAAPSGGTTNRTNPVQRVDRIDQTYTGFSGGLSVIGVVDVDLDSVGNSTEDYQTVFFNNGTADNSEITVTFTSVIDSSVVTLSQVVPDQSGTGPYDFSQSG